MPWLYLLAAWIAAAYLLQAPDLPPVWLWVRGRLPDPRENWRYRQHFAKMVRYYEEDLGLVVETVDEEELDELPRDQVVVFAGPAGAYRNPEILGLPVQVRPGGFCLAGRDLDIPGLGLYLQGPESPARIFFTGSDLRGYHSCFSVPTGQDDCVLILGNERYRGPLPRQPSELPALDFLPRLPQPAPRPKQRPGLSPQACLDGDQKPTPAFLEWLDKKTKDSKVILLGERHWNTTCHTLQSALVRHLASERDLDLVIFECPFSRGSLFDHYVGLSDQEAADFLTFLGEPLATYEGHFRILETIRHLNRDNPQVRIRAAAHDLEWALWKVRDEVLMPFLEVIAPDFASQWARTKHVPTLADLEALEGFQDRFSEHTFVPERPYLTGEVYRQVLINLRGTFEVMEGGPERMTRRQELLIRNLTEFLGEELREGLALMIVGGFHAQKRSPQPQAPLPESTALAEFHPATRGRVHSIRMEALGYRFEAARASKAKELIRGAALYRGLLSKYRRARRAGLADPEAYYMLEPPTELERKILEDVPQEIHAVFADPDFETLEAELGHPLTKDRGDLSGFDGAIWVLRGDLDRVQPKPPRPPRAEDLASTKPGQGPKNSSA